ncbi:MAG: TolC family protein [Ghiorsea sp.]
MQTHLKHSALNALALGLITMLILPHIASAIEQKTSLKISVAYALEHNRSLVATANNVDAAQAQVSAANGLFLPRVDVATGVYRSNSPLSTFGTKLLQERVATSDFAPALLNNPDYINNYQSRLGLTMPLYKGGENYAIRNKATANTAEIELKLQFKKQQVIYQTIITYIQVRQALAKVEAQTQAIKAAEQRLRDAKALKKRGMAIQSDVMDANVYLLRNQLALDDVNNQFENSLEALHLVLGMPSQQKLGELEQPRIRNIQTSLEKLLATANQNRADLLALIQQGEAASATSKQAQSGYLPHVNLTAAREWNGDTLGLRNGNNTVGLTVSMNLFAGGGDSANIHAAESARISLSLQQHDKEQQIANEIRQAWRSLKTAKRKLSNEAEAYKQTTESLRIKALRHQQGLEKTTDLLASQVRADQARVSLIRATYDTMIAKAALFLAAGTLTQGVVQ